MTAAKRIELLAPAKDLECGQAAIQCGADAVYLGAARFGARAGACNSINDIEALARFAHCYWAKVYVTLNTILQEAEIPQAVQLARQMYEAGLDGLIIQDVGLLECDLPPLPLIASTQMHNHTPERVAFLEQAGFQRAILARELSLEEIRRIRAAAPNIELECFVHGALCVSYSGQCYMSYAVGGRSGNRGQCAQPCRKKYDLMDNRGKVLAKGRHLLSLKDLNLSDCLEELLQAGISSFKIEGRLKDRLYVSNVVSYYRRRLDAIIQNKQYQDSSSGRCYFDFDPNLEKTFNRGFTTYFVHGRRASPGSVETPKMMGEFIGKVVSLGQDSFEIKASRPLHKGDGICFFGQNHTLCGVLVNDAAGSKIVPDRMDHLKIGAAIYRNHDYVFLAALDKARPQRKIELELRLKDSDDGFALFGVDEDGNQADFSLPCNKLPADKKERAEENLRRQLGKLGGTDFVCSVFINQCSGVYFLPVSYLNALRRGIVEQMACQREQNRPKPQRRADSSNALFPEKQLDYAANVLNKKAECFYRRHGVSKIEGAAETGMDMTGQRVMTTRYCIKHQLGYCDGQGHPQQLEEPLYLVDEDQHRYMLRFCCQRCEMEVYF